MVKALLIGDVHLSDSPPSVRTETYTQDILDKLEFCVNYANEHTDVIVQLGDMFHVKAASKNSHALVQATAAVLSKFNGRVLIVPGNHDLSQDRLESLSKQPLGTLALTPNVELIDGFDEETGIYGIPYLDNIDEMRGRIRIGVPPWHDTKLFVTHASIFPPGKNPPYDHITADHLETDGIPLAWGHIHDPVPFFQAGEFKAWFCNNGAISRGSLHTETVKRKPKVTLFDSEVLGCPFTSVDVPHKPAEEVFRLVAHAEKVESEERLNEFLGSIQETNLTSLSMEDVLSSPSLSDLSDQAKAELAEIIELVVHS